MKSGVLFVSCMAAVFCLVNSTTTGSTDTSTGPTTATSRTTDSVTTPITETTMPSSAAPTTTAAGAETSTASVTSRTVATGESSATTATPAPETAMPSSAAAPLTTAASAAAAAGAGTSTASVTSEKVATGASLATTATPAPAAITTAATAAAPATTASVVMSTAQPNITYPTNVHWVSTPQTILAGGIQLLVGSDGNMKEVGLKAFLVFTTSDSNTTQPQHPCTAINDTLISCPTPALTALLTATKTASSNSPTKWTVSADIWFEPGHNITHLSDLSVFSNPSLEPLTQLTEFKANQGNFITIQGSSLTDHGFTAADINVTIGQPQWMSTGTNVCGNVSLTDKTITCYPPPMKPDLIHYPPTSGELPAQPNVTVKIGEYEFAANQLQYVLDESFSIVMMVMIAILGCVVVVSLICVALTCCGVGRRPQSPLGSIHGTASSAPYIELPSDETKLSSEEQMAAQAQQRSSVKMSRVSETGKGNSASGVQVKAMRKKSEFDSDGGYDNAVYENEGVRL